MGDQTISRLTYPPKHKHVPASRRSEVALSTFEQFKATQQPRRVSSRLQFRVFPFPSATPAKASISAFTSLEYCNMSVRNDFLLPYGFTILVSFDTVLLKATLSAQEQSVIFWDGYRKGLQNREPDLLSDPTDEESKVSPVCRSPASVISCSVWWHRDSSIKRIHGSHTSGSTCEQHKYQLNVMRGSICTYMVR